MMGTSKGLFIFMLLRAHDDQNGYSVSSHQLPAPYNYPNDNLYANAGPDFQHTNVPRYPAYEHRYVDHGMHEMARVCEHHQSDQQHYPNRPCSACIEYADPAIGLASGYGHENPFQMEPQDFWTAHDREMCPSPGDSLRISRFPSPPSHPFDPYYEMKMHAVECMINSPDHYSSDDESCSDGENPSEEVQTDGRESPAGPYVPRGVAQERWPSPPRSVGAGELAGETHFVHNTQAAEQVMNQHHSGKGPAHAVQHHYPNHSAHPQYMSSRHSAMKKSSHHPGVGYFELPDAFIAEFVL